MTEEKEIARIDLNGVDLPVQVHVEVTDGIDLDQLARNIVDAGDLAEATSAVELLRTLCTMTGEDNNGLGILAGKCEKLLEERRFLEAWVEAEEAAKAAEGEEVERLDLKTILTTVGVAVLAVVGMIFLWRREKYDVIGDITTEAVGKVLKGGI